MAPGLVGMNDTFVLKWHVVMGYYLYNLLAMVTLCWGGVTLLAMGAWVSTLGLVTRRHRAGAVYPRDDSNLFIFDGV